MRFCGKKTTGNGNTIVPENEENVAPTRSSTTRKTKAEITTDKKTARQEKTLSKQFVPLKKKREEQKSQQFKLRKTG